MMEQRGTATEHKRVGLSCPRGGIKRSPAHSTVTDLARFRGLSMSHPRMRAM